MGDRFLLLLIVGMLTVDTMEEVVSVDDDDDDGGDSLLFPVAASSLSSSTVPRPIEQSNVSKYFSISGPHLDIPLRLLVLLSTSLGDEALILPLLPLLGGFHGSIE